MKSLAFMPGRLLACAVLFSLAAGACGGKSAPETPEALVDSVVNALKEGKIDPMKAALPTKADFEEAAPLAGEEMSAEKIAKAQAKVESKVTEAFAELQEAGKDVDWASVKVVSVEAKERKEKDLVGYRITAKLEAGDKKGELKLRAFKLGRGLIFDRPPRLNMGADCRAAVEHMIKLAGESEDDMAKRMHERFSKDLDKMVADCEKDIARKPERKKDLSCMVKATDFKAAMGCMR